MRRSRSRSILFVRPSRNAITSRMTERYSSFVISPTHGAPQRPMW